MMSINKLKVSQCVHHALFEDLGAGDVSAQLLPENLQASAQIISREPMVVAGIPWVDATFQQVDASVKIAWQVRDAEFCPVGRVLCTITGPARAILTAERTALNFLQTLSGTATETRRYIEQLRGTHTQLLDTRKTMPGLRYAQKYAVRCGGGVNHRMGLYDAYLIKENHLNAFGSIRNAIEAVRAQQDDLMIEVEVETLAQLKEALALKPDRILLDNFSYDMLKAAIQINQPKQCPLEASGGINLQNIRTIAETGVDFVSVGELTKSVRAIDLSLLFGETVKGKS